jgi:hypothetical protein
MKSATDTVTMELPLEGGRRARGRPKLMTPKLTPAQRQQARRDRLAKAGKRGLTVKITGSLLDQLEAWMDQSKTTQDDAVETALKEFLASRFSALKKEEEGETGGEHKTALKEFLDSRF